MGPSRPHHSQASQWVRCRELTAPVVGPLQVRIKTGLYNARAGDVVAVLDPGKTQKRKNHIHSLAVKVRRPRGSARVFMGLLWMGLGAAAPCSLSGRCLDRCSTCSGPPGWFHQAWVV
jgi:hypothetical protein